jgi:heme-degrading monooxygenase HmoA
MVTIVTEISLKEGAEPRWDEVMLGRMAAAREQPGWVGGQLLRPTADPQRRVIVGTWRTREDWHAWHTDPRFQDTRAELDPLVRGSEEHCWHDVVLEVRGEPQAGLPPHVGVGRSGA